MWPIQVRCILILNDQYLKLELFNGYDYTEGNGSGQDEGGRTVSEETYRKTKFSKMQVVLDLSSFGMSRTDTKWFKGNRIMRNLSELEKDMDSVRGEINNQVVSLYTGTQQLLFTYHFKYDSIPLPKDLVAFKEKRDSLSTIKARESQMAKTNSTYSSYGNPVTPAIFNLIKRPDSITTRERKRSDSVFAIKLTRPEVSNALNKARVVKSQLQNLNINTSGQRSEFIVFWIQWHKILANSIACLAMFLIGAPLGSIIKKGGLGVPVLVSILFFILYYVLDLMGVKWARQELVSVFVGVWMANAILFAIGFFFLRQARVDARLFDADFYHVVVDKLSTRLGGILKRSKVG